MKHELLLKSLIVTLIAISSYWSMRGAGVSCHLFQIISMTGILIFSLQTKRFFKFIILPIYSVLCLYFPVGIHYGMPEYGHIASLFATDAIESIDFLKSIPTWQFYIPFVLIGGIICIRKLSLHLHLNFHSNRCFYFFLSLFILSLASITQLNDAFYETVQYFRLTPWWKYLLFSLFFISAAIALFSKKFTASKFPLLFPLIFLVLAYMCGDFRPIYKGIKGTVVVLRENARMQKLIQSNDWIITESLQKYKIYLLIIGESARRDYMHSYGYPVRNTDFMDSVNGIIFKGFTSEGDETIPSLRRALTYSKASREQVNYSLNIIGLANKAGFATSWFSNQGFAHSADTPVSAIGSQAHIKRWIRVGYSLNHSDQDLLPLMKAEIQRPDDHPKFIVLHINGSHPGVCGPVSPKTYASKVGNPYYKESFCYVENIRQTDELLRDAYNILTSSGLPFSMIYFSDHGLSHSEIAGQLVLKHANPGNRSRDIPLFRASSDDRAHLVVQGRRFGDSLTEGIAQWLGIKTKQIPNPRDLFSSEDDPDSHGHEALMKQRRDDPAINILEHMTK